MESNPKTKTPKYYLLDSGEFVIENYNHAKPFANFFPGIAGKYGIPMWVFYVNRGQGISSFGIKDKDHSLLEFFPANKSWQFTPTQGFRTFIKVFSGKSYSFYEPFHNGFTNLKYKLSNKMLISSSGLTIEEINTTLGLKVKVEYFNIPNDNYAGLARIVSVTNLGNSKKKIQLLDGLPQIIPYGTSNFFLKKLGRTIEAWMKVKNLETGVPFFKLDVDPSDKPEVIHIKEGNFYLSFHSEKNKTKIIKPIVDVQSIFGPVTDFSCPRQFLTETNFRAPKDEVLESRTPSAFSLLNIELGKKEEKKLYSVIGYMRSQELLNSSIKKICAPGYLMQKSQENKQIVDNLTQEIDTVSSSKEFNLYAKQTYLDNILRGGYPVVFQSESGKALFYLYSRKHGDLERDYNKFLIQPTYYSQGNGNYRDVNQNRRSDIWFNPQIEEENLVNLLNLIQADGFNPLVVKGLSFKLKDTKKFEQELNNLTDEKSRKIIMEFLQKAFSPGEVILFIEDNGIKLKASYDRFLGNLINYSDKLQEAEHGEGFWTDHWAYNLDLLDSYLGVYPEQLKEILFTKKIFTFFDNTETVRPREEKYMLYEGLVKQLHSVATDTAKKEIIHKRAFLPHIVRTQYGSGDIYKTTLINKLTCLLVNKLASLDPSGVGIEMEANKPNWYDALNGLPALFGSSLCETLELKRLALFIKEALENLKISKVEISEEVCDFLVNLKRLISENLNENPEDKDFIYWDKSYTLKEHFRNKVKLGFSGKELALDAKEYLEILALALRKLDIGINKAKKTKDDIYYSYFYHEVEKYEPLKTPFVKPTKFTQKKVSFFLEGQMHALRLAHSLNEAKSIYKATKNSELFDKKLKMYKVTAPLSSMPEEIGRCRVFTPGWLENESIWLHMEYKYLLETLRSGLYDEFYEDFRNVLVAFQKPLNYGRSILENSSFLVSSAFPDKELHGNGFVARLSGSTAEFLQIWLTMNVGQKPFFLNDKNQLNLIFKPVLAGWLFDKKGNYSFNFLSTISLTYHNPRRKNTFGKDSAKIKKIIFSDNRAKDIELAQDTIPSPYAEQIRLRQIRKIDIYLE